MNREDFLNEATYSRASADEYLWWQTKTLGISRRRLIQLMAGTVGSSAIALWPQAATSASTKVEGIVKNAPPEFFFQKGSNLEMKWEQMYNRGYIVPNELFFVRNNSPTPQINASRWRLTVKGTGVTNPQTFTYDDLLKLPSSSVIKALECAGNGRSFFKLSYGKEADGTQWQLGGIGVAEWTGVPLRELLERAGIKKTAKDVMPISLDKKKLARPMPVEKALSDAILVYGMNGEFLPPDHGYPARVLVPGWAGIASVKWVGAIEVSETPLWTEWNTTEYVLIGADYKPPSGSPAKGEMVTSQKVKSAFELPFNATLKSGKQLLRGRSWSGQGKIAKVELSFDAGKTWQLARIQPELNLPQAWAMWDYEWEAPPGDYQLMARATDDRGVQQPLKTQWNDKGYLYWGIVQHRVTVTEPLNQKL
jgi:DMSO/TMAO reductase YedYZ molybdopterin-dependent catalytic subunit